ncbi:LON peptidase substrate-binding domain-containing protein [Pseudoduganella chitinolytica]|uniref:LON peptidase substrate-binding domain-containing protein n=1 Tax=Pseudoduganella chitinolytica TaxID=34070 RepID=A0ABY8BGF8_9BURK|nr:LON peptidase substrate-binding domain-containing protein [Pseudoduganella chitinolytica]WEF35012.1 LON peptidase substrate-binding domain-containing protein [Pseudoduganella chitinolytica]
MIPLFPLNTILFPDGRLALQVFEVRYLDMIRKCIANGGEFGIVPLAHGDEVRKPGQHEALCSVGTLARVLEWTAPLPGLMQITCLGTQRFRIEAATQLPHGLWMAEVTRLPDDLAIPIPNDQQDVANALGSLIRTLQQRGVTGAQMPMHPPYRLDDSGWVANRWCELLQLDMVQKELLLAQENPVLRLELVQDALTENGLLN